MGGEGRPEEAMGMNMIYLSVSRGASLKCTKERNSYKERHDYDGRLKNYFWSNNMEETQ